MPIEPPKYYPLEDTNGTGKFDRGDDLDSNLKVTLGDYLSEKTKASQSGNKYTIAPGTSEHVTFTDDNGHPSPLVTGQGSGEKVFIDQIAEGAKAYFEKVSNSGIFDTAVPADKMLIDLINKRIQEDGHGLLSSIEGTNLDSSGQSVTPGAPKTLLEEKIQGVLLNNRFNPSGNSPYIKDGRRSESFGQKQSKFGEYEENAKVSYEVEDLTKIACSLLLKSSGRLTENEDPSEYDSGNILTVGAGAGGSLGPLTTVRIGTKKIGAGDLDAANAYGGNKLTSRGTSNSELIETSGPDGEKAQADGFGTPGSSFGQMWSHLEPFAPSGAFSASPIALLLPQFAVIATITAVIGLLVGLLTPGAGFKKPTGSEPVPSDLMKKGAHEQANKTIGFGIFAKIRQALGVPNTKNPYTSSVFTGLLWFQTSAIWGGAGFVTNAQRGVARDVIEFGSGISEKFSGGFVSDLQGIGILIHELTTSKSFRFVQVMATMGDKVLTQWKKNEKYFSSSVHGFLRDGDIDTALDYGETRAGKSRSEKNKQTLAWRNNSVSSAYLYPSRLADAMSKYKFSKDSSYLKGTGNDIDQYIHMAQKGKLDPQVIKGVEDNLESEYVPFYFHDLRTNEIIAFHAFLSNITDKYSPNWEAVDGIGRVEPVQIYGSTTRDISIEFTAVATNDDDFDAMWFKINKLVTLVYPQWSRGRFVTQGDTKFIQPMSQVKTASPVIRLRLGDLLKSNYSRFALARLFGLTEEEFTIEGESTSLDPNSIESIIGNKELVTLIKENISYSMEDGIIVDSGKTYKISEKPTMASSNGDTLMLSKPLKGKIISIPIPKVSETDNAATMAGKAANAGNPATAGESTDTETPSINLEYVVELSDNEGDFEIYNGFKIVVSNNDVTYSPLEALNAARLLAAEDPSLIPSKFPDNFRDFMAPENNAIVRSFESTRGRGLAGVIKGLDFTWTDMPWEISQGSRAPQMCKISIQFTPIHDIQPGIDNSGFNRAPIYNVGNIMKGINFDPYDGDDST